MYKISNITIINTFIFIIVFIQQTFTTNILLALKPNNFNAAAKHILGNATLVSYDWLTIEPKTIAYNLNNQSKICGNLTNIYDPFQILTCEEGMLVFARFKSS